MTTRTSHVSHVGPIIVPPSRNGEETFLVKFEDLNGVKRVNVRAKDLDEAIPRIRRAFQQKYGGRVPKVGIEARHGIINFD